MTAPIRSMPEGKQCRRKVRHDSERDAQIEMRANHGRACGMNVYFCPHCEFWHVGHAAREDA